jgi:hypothetical protein
MVRELQGYAQMIARLRKLKAFSPDLFAAALYQESQIEATECKKNTPVLTGNLRATIHVEGPFREGRRIWCTIVAGEGGSRGIVTAYALIVHEDMEAFHKVGGPKYIEWTLRASAPSMGARVAKRIDLNAAVKGSGSDSVSTDTRVRDEKGRFA